MDSSETVKVPVTRQSDWEVLNLETKATSAVFWTFLDHEFVDVRFHEDDEEKQVRFVFDDTRRPLHAEYKARLIHGKFATNKSCIVDDNGDDQPLPEVELGANVAN